MNDRILNFSGGPAVMPLPVLERAGAEITSLNGIGAGVMEISHRSADFEGILNHAENGLRGLLHVPEYYSMLFLQGGASLQFTMIPLNFLPAGRIADYLITGAWGEKALAEARKCGDVRIADFRTADGFISVPEQADLAFDHDSAYVHYTSNETIDGVEFKYDLDGSGIPVICDASSNILSKPIDIDKYAVIYAGAQKNIGPSGVTVVIMREDMLERVPDNQHSLLDYRKIAAEHSMVNTPNTWGIYLIGLVCDWLEEQGGVEGIELRNREKAAILYDAIDSSEGFYRCRVKQRARSLMNVTFHLPTKELDELFCKEAKELRMDGLRGHRSVGGIRASIYNAFPVAGVRHLAEFMKGFAERHG
jgi:phosphoserine aminotransferase